MEIKSFEPYHIGTKMLPHVNLDILESKLRKALREIGYEGTQKATVELPVKIGPPVETLGIKNEVRVELNLSATALNIIGVKPERVIEVFREVNAMLPNLDYDLEATVAFYEIIATVIIKSTTHPREIINNACRIDLSALKDLGEVVCDSLRIVNIQPTEEQGAIRFVIEPSPTNPNTSFSVRLVYRALKKEKIEPFHAELGKIVLSIVESLERE